MIGRKQVGTAVVWIALALPPPAAPQTPPRAPAPQLTAVRLRSTEQSIRVTFVLTAPVRYKMVRSEQPPKITIDLLQTGISPVFTKRELLSVHPALIRVLVSRSAGVTRAAIDLAAAGAHSVYAANNEVVVEIKTRAKRSTTDVTPPTKAASAAPLPIAGPGSPPPHVVPLPPQPAAPPPLTSVKIPWVPLGPTIDALMADNHMATAARLTSFRQREPGDGTPASEDTTVYLAYDSDFLYAAFICRDAGRDVRSNLVPRDTLGGDDHVALYLDTFRDGRHAYVFASNAFGVQQDGVISEGDDVSYVPDMLWRSQGRRTANGFVVLMSIPFKSLRFSDASVQSWRVAVGRTIARTGETAYWPYITRGPAGFVGQMAALEGLELISPGRNIQLMPYGTFAREQLFDAAARGPMSEVARGGLDAKVVVRGAAAIDATVNPDFSEVESDDPLVTANQRFELFRPEKRPFFMENAAMFESPINVMFSRRIVDPDVGLRLTARTTGWTIGGLVANDRGGDTDRSTRLFGPGTRIGVARLQRLFGERSALGVSATDRDGSDGRNHVASVDGRIQLTPAWGFIGQLIRSDDQSRGEGRQVGHAYSAALSRTGAHFTYVGSYRDIGPTVRVPLGFVPRVDVRGTDHYAGYTWRIGESGAWSVGPMVNAIVQWNHAGQLQDRWTSGALNISRAGYFDANIARAQSFERFGTADFRTDSTNLTLSSRVHSAVYLWGMYYWGSAINYTPAAGVVPFLGVKRGAYGSVALRPSARLDLQQIVLHEQFDTAHHDARVFETTIYRSQATLQVTRAMLVRGMADFNELSTNRSLFADTDGRDLTYDVIVRFSPNPGTAFFVGFNKRYENLHIDPRARTLGMLPTMSATPVGERIFAKVSYLFRL